MPWPVASPRAWQHPSWRFSWTAEPMQMWVELLVRDVGHLDPMQMAFGCGCWLLVLDSAARARDCRPPSVHWQPAWPLEAACRRETPEFPTATWWTRTASAVAVAVLVVEGEERKDGSRAAQGPSRWGELEHPRLLCARIISALGSAAKSCGADEATFRPSEHPPFPTTISHPLSTYSRPCPLAAPEQP